MIFSIIIPTYNRKLLLAKCLQSINDVDFSRNDYEVIVVDDGSTDGTREFLSRLSGSNFRAFFRNHGGPAKARNWGVQNASGEYIAFTDDDCLVPTDWISKIQQGLISWPEACAVGGYLEAPSDVLSNKLAAKLESLETHEVYKAGEKEYLGGFESPAGGTNNVAYRRAVFNELGGFDESFPEPAGEDADLKYRAVKAGYKIGYLPLKVTHLDPYSFKTFLRRSIVYGIGSLYFEKKNYGTKPTRHSLFFGSMKIIISSLFLSIFTLIKNDDRSKVKLIRNIRGVLINYGKFKYLSGL